MKDSGRPRSPAWLDAEVLRPPDVGGAGSQQNIKVVALSQEVV